MVLCLEMTAEGQLTSHMLQAEATSPAAAPLGGWSQVHSMITSLQVEIHLPASLSPVNRRNRKYSLQPAAASPMPIISSTDYSMLTTIPLPSSNYSSSESPSLQQNKDHPSDLPSTPSPIANSPPGHSNSSSVPSGLVQPPLSPLTGKTTLIFQLYFSILLRLFRLVWNTYLE